MINKRLPRDNYVYFYPSIKKTVCAIPKNGHTVSTYIYCLLLAYEKGIHLFNTFFLDGKKNIATQAYSKACKALSSEKAHNSSLSNNNEIVVFIRDPLNRFVSAWSHMCKM